MLGDQEARWLWKVGRARMETSTLPGSVSSFSWASLRPCVFLWVSASLSLSLSLCMDVPGAVA